MQSEKQKNGREKIKEFDIEAVSERRFEKLLKLVRDIWFLWEFLLKFLLFVWHLILAFALKKKRDAF